MCCRNAELARTTSTCICFLLSLVKTALNITVVFEALLNSKSTAALWNSVDLRTTQHVQRLDICVYMYI